MPRSTWILASAVTLVLLSIASAAARAAKPVPPPAPPTIVAQLDGFAVASDGAVYEFATTANTVTCAPSLTSAVVYGRFFTTPPVSPITSVISLPFGFQATSANGDMWFLNRYDPAPCFKTGLYMGNIFTVAGVTPALAPSYAPPIDLAPIQSAPETSKDGAAATHGPRSVPPVAGAVE